MVWFEILLKHTFLLRVEVLYSAQLLIHPWQSQEGLQFFILFFLKFAFSMSVSGSLMFVLLFI